MEKTSENHQKLLKPMENHCFGALGALGTLEKSLPGGCAAGRRAAGWVGWARLAG